MSARSDTAMLGDIRLCPGNGLPTGNRDTLASDQGTVLCLSVGQTMSLHITRLMSLHGSAEVLRSKHGSTLLRLTQERAAAAADLW